MLCGIAGAEVGPAGAVGVDLGLAVEGWGGPGTEPVEARDGCLGGGGGG